MTTTPAVERLTYEDYLALPETMQPYSIIDGEMIMSPGPVSDHQWISSRVVGALRGHIEQRKLGVVLFSPIDVLIRRAPLRVRQPDVLYLSAARTGVTGRKELRKMPVITVAPDLIVEVLSPSESRSDVEGKLEDFQHIGVLEGWLVSPEAQTVEVLRLENMETIGLFGMGQSVTSEVLPELALQVDTLFE